LKLLYQLKGNPMTFSHLYSKSKIRMKKSFLNYLHLCVNYNFIEKETVGPNVIYTITDKPNVIYTITDKGRIMLNLFMQKSN